MESSTKTFYWWTDLSQLITGRLNRGFGMTVGNFDGVHLGHRSLLKEVVDWSNLHQELSLVLTFNPHPQYLLYPEKKHMRLFDFEDQKEQFRQLGLSAVLLQSFSRDFSEQSAESFFRNYLLAQIRPKFLAVGHDFTFGRNKEGSRQLLEKICRQECVELKVVPPYRISDSVVVSTSEIRQALSLGDVGLARKMLGRYYYLRGIVEHGEERGRQLGFPTANLRPSVDFCPRTGVYATWCWIDGVREKSVTNIGYNKTFIEPEASIAPMAPIKIETHILDRQIDLYGHEIRIELVKFMRDEKKFSNIDELKKQISQDCKKSFEVLLGPVQNE